MEGARGNPDTEESSSTSHATMRPQNERCPFFLYYTFLWMTPFVNRIKKQRKADPSDIPPLPSTMDYHKTLTKIKERIAINNDAGHMKRAKIHSLLMHLSWFCILLSFTLISIVAFLSAMQPKTISVMLQILSTPHVEALRASKSNVIIALFREAWIWIVVGFFAQIVSTLLQSIATTVCIEQSIKISQALNIVLYEKLLKTSSLTAIHVLSPAVINLINGDAHSASNLIVNIPRLMLIPAKLLMIVLFIILQITPSALAGFGGILITLPFIAGLVIYNFLLEKHYAVVRDLRVKYVTEVIVGMHVVKAYNYQDLYRERMHVRRQKELSYVGRITLIQSCIHIVGYMTWPAMLLCGFLSMNRANAFTNENAYTVAYLFNMFVRVLIDIPYLLTSLNAAFVSCGRMEQFLSLPEVSQEAPSLRSDHEQASSSSQNLVVWTVGSPTYSWGQVRHRAVPSLFNSEKPSISKLKKIIDALEKSYKQAILKYKTLIADAPSDLLTLGALASIEGEPSMESEAYAIFSTEFEIPQFKENFFLQATDLIATLTPRHSDSLLTQIKKSYLQVVLSLKSIETAQAAIKDSSEDFPPILKSLTFSIHKGDLVGIGGRVGSGKTSLLLAILGELALDSSCLQRVPGIFTIGRIAYCPQTPAIFTGSVRFNIHLFAHYNEAKMKLAIELSQLDSDLSELANGLDTLVGTRGATLSGGQKARISLARAIYSDADIYILDDIFSSLDATVAKIIWTDTIINYLLKQNKTVVFATNQLEYLQFCKKVLYIDNNILRELSYEEIAAQKAKYSDEQSSTIVQTDITTSFGTNRAGDLNQNQDPSIIKQEWYAALGSVNPQYYKMWFQLGSRWRFILYILFWVVCIFMLQLASLLINFWTEQRLNLTVSGYVGLFLAFTVAFMVFLFLGQLFYMLFSKRASERLYNNMIEGLLNATMKFYNSNPLGRILNRLTGDTGTCDLAVKNGLSSTCENAIFVLGSLLAILIMSWPSTFFLVPLLLLFLWLFISFRSVSPLLRRTTAMLGSHVLTLILDSYYNIPSLRIYQCEKQAIENYAQTVVALESAFWMDVSLYKWIHFSTTLLSICVFPIIIVSAIVTTALGHGTIVSGTVFMNGFDVILMLVDMCFGIVAMDLSMASVERVVEYSQLKPERTSPLSAPNDLTTSINLDEHFNALAISNLAMRYQENLPFVIQNVSLTLNRGESLAIVGKTGSGKSSLANILLRLADPEPGAKIILNGVDILQMDVHDARAKIAMIFQDPFIFSGTLREYLSADRHVPDEELWRVLEKLHLRDYFERQPAQLEFSLLSNGENLSLGQRQLLCVAHALLKDSDVILLDEVTAHIDKATELIIQEVLQQCKAKKLVIAIAHKLRSICSFDKVVVMSEGRIVEQGSPRFLLNHPNSMFVNLVDNSIDRDEIAKMLGLGFS